MGVVAETRGVVILHDIFHEDVRVGEVGDGLRDDTLLLRDAFGET